ncbi:MAG: FAD-dependent oxidoreductase [Anaerolineales bacterium]|nr:FAD-dependent oxidoreductase [Anaerolineales bacterium]
MRRYVGDSVYDALWRPMLVGKFGEENLDVVNMAWMWARIKARTTRLGTFKGGFQTFLNKLADVIRTDGVEIRLSTPVTRIRQDDAGRLTVTTSTGSETYDAVISTSSPALMARLMPDLPASYAGSLTALKSMGAVVLVISIRQRLTEYYWHNLPKDAGFFLAMVEHTNFIDRNTTAATTSSTAATTWSGPRILRLSKEELLERFLPALKRFNPDFDRTWSKTRGSGRPPMRSRCRRSTIPRTSRPSAHPCLASTSPA